MNVEHIGIDRVGYSLAEILQSVWRADLQQMIDQWMFESMSRVFRRHRRRHGDGNRITGPAPLSGFEMHGNYADIVIGSIANKINTSLRQFSDEITEDFVFCVVGSRYA